jgi:glycoside hydrolase-like protein
MAGQVVDYSWARPGGGTIKNAGYVGVMRYLSYEPGKTINQAELDDLRSNGLDLGLVWETTANRAMSGRVGGQADAKAGLGQADSLGYPSSCPLYFAVDFDASEAQQVVINQYFQGACDVLGVGRVGTYGSFYVVERCFAAGVASYGWQTLAWSGGQVSGKAALYQNGKTAFGGGADVNDVRGDYGPWLAAGPQPAPGPPVPRGGHSMYHPSGNGRWDDAIVGTNGHIYHLYAADGDPAHVSSEDWGGVGQPGTALPDWSPDGKHFMVRVVGSDYQVYYRVVNVTGELEQDWTPAAGAVAAPYPTQPGPKGDPGSKYDDTLLTARVGTLEGVWAKIRAILAG